MSCPCGTGKAFEACCGPFLNETALPETAEALMRSRYTAYTRNDLKYLMKTLAPEAQRSFNMAATKKWMQEAEWKGLKILSVEQGQAADTRGTVEFVATYAQNGQGIDHHEVSRFRKTSQGQWLFIEGDYHTHEEGQGHHHHHHRPQTAVREEPKIGRNDPCPCGSGKKFKKCCGAAD